jgi:hypothetical protein
MSLPRATVRLQLHRDFGFDAAAACAGYYAELGISHYYLSPIWAARPGRCTAMTSSTRAASILNWGARTGCCAS